MKRSILSRVSEVAHRLRHRDRERYACPICDYEGPFRDLHPSTGLRRDAMCPRCRSLERHRLQALVVDTIFAERPAGQLRMLHFAPEAFFRERFAREFGRYETADLVRPGVQHHVDLQSLPFEDGSYDVVYASHVLEHVPDDMAALAQIRRVLAPGGIAILPVPIVCASTVEYPAPNPSETDHVRAPGVDYFDRYRAVFRAVDVYASTDFAPVHQLFIQEDRSGYPRADSPHRTAMSGTRHPDYVPVCRV